MDPLLELVRKHIRPETKGPTNGCLDGLAVSTAVGVTLALIVAFAVYMSQTTPATYVSSQFAPGCEGLSRPLLHRLQPINITIDRPGTAAADLFNGPAICSWSYEFIANDACSAAEHLNLDASILTHVTASQLVCVRNRTTAAVYFHLEMAGKLSLSSQEYSFPNELSCAFDSQLSHAHMTFPPCDGFAAQGTIVRPLQQVLFDISGVWTNTSVAEELMAQTVGGSRRTTMVAFDNFLTVSVPKPVDCREGKHT